MPHVPYRIKLEEVTVPNTANLLIRSLLDQRQYHDPDGEAAQLGISSALWPLFGLLWPSAIYLAGHLALRSTRPEEQILEIGCGLALPSLVCHRRGARVTASDRHPLAGAFLRENLHLNRLPPTLRYRHGHWGPDAPSAQPPHAQALTGRHDLVIGSDLLYERDTPPALAGFIDRHALPSAEAWIVDANRGHRQAFNRHMARHRFVLYDEVRLNRAPCLTGAHRYKGRLLKYRRAD
ncbi:SAM-dependent methyltransferase [Castellaniella sp. GW247-6E4]|uniref:class I SAM-dependent methyltransferase n=1 Tax=Castellaniella sp. GW247-6E4 TaxID=3140380 RepID=UPI003315FF5F